MAGELTNAAQEFFAAVDAKDIDRLTSGFADDAQGVDELSRRWIRGRSEIESYLRQLLDAVSEVRTEFRDPHELVWGEAGVVTGWVEQDYTLDGESQHVSAPTTIVFRREAGEWKGVLFHSIPLPEQM
jgi:ketosteroid isomerase-like protein